MSNLVHNERIKLFATFCSNLAVATLVGAFFLPAISRLSQTHRLSGEIFYVTGGIVLTFAFHLFARWKLGQLKE